MRPDQVHRPSGRSRLILVVCTANICRSPFAAGLLRDGLAELGQIDFAVESAGTDARRGDPACGRLWTAAGLPAPERGDHSSRSVSRDMVGQADLILALGASNSSALAVVSPKSRPITFKLAVAARLASLIVSPDHALASATGSLPQVDDLDQLARVPVLPQSAPDRFDWLVAEMDAWRASIADSESDSVVDPHGVADDRHPAVAGEIADLVAGFVRAVRAVVLKA